MPTPLGLYLFFTGALLLICGGHDNLAVAALACGVCFEGFAFIMAGIVSDYEAPAAPEPTDEELGIDDGSR